MYYLQHDQLQTSQFLDMPHAPYKSMTTLFEPPGPTKGSLSSPSSAPYRSCFRPRIPPLVIAVPPVLVTPVHSPLGPQVSQDSTRVAQIGPLLGCDYEFGLLFCPFLLSYETLTCYTLASFKQCFSFQLSLASQPYTRSKCKHG